MVFQRDSHLATAPRTAWQAISPSAAGTKPEGSIGTEIRILIADDCDDWRICAREILRQRVGWHVVGEAHDGLETVERAAELRPDVVLLDIGMPGLDGIKVARKIRHASPSSRIIFVTQFEDSDIVNAALDEGANGYVTKTKAASQLAKAISAALPLRC